VPISRHRNLGHDLPREGAYIYVCCDAKGLARDLQKFGDTIVQELGAAIDPRSG